MATGYMCVKCGDQEQTPQNDTCVSCARKIHARFRKTLKQMFESANRTRVQVAIQETVIAKIDYETGKVERVDKQALVDSNLVKIVGYKPSKRAARTAQIKAKAASVKAQLKLNDRRRTSSNRQQQTAVH
jgi:DNA-directed RNA polymerase subunit RPC12/RpoP